MFLGRYISLFLCISCYIAGANYHKIRNLAKAVVSSTSSPKNDEVVCPTKDTIAIGYFGQSNSTNHVRPVSQINFSNNLYQYDWRTGLCYQYREPLVAVGGRFGNSISYFANTLATNSKVPVLIVPFGIPGSAIHEWSYGNISHYYKAVLSFTKENNIEIDLFMWHQGESDSEHPSANLSSFTHFNPAEGFTQNDFMLGTTEKNYILALQEIIRVSRLYFPESYFGIAIASLCGDNDQWRPVQQAQVKVAKTTPRAFLTANSDELSGNIYRFDGCHFSQAGAIELGKQYMDSFSSINHFKKILVR